MQAEPHNTPYHLPYHQPFVLSAILVSAMPTGNTVIMLIEMAGGSGLTLTAIIFLEPICTTPPPLTPPGYLLPYTHSDDLSPARLYYTPPFTRLATPPAPPTPPHPHPHPHPTPRSRPLDTHSDDLSAAGRLSARPHGNARNDYRSHFRRVGLEGEG